MNILLGWISGAIIGSGFYMASSGDTYGILILCLGLFIGITTIIFYD